MLSWECQHEGPAEVEDAGCEEPTRWKASLCFLTLGFRRRSLEAEHGAASSRLAEWFGSQSPGGSGTS